jgi:hypothetical protein
MASYHNFITAQKKSDVVHDMLAFLAEQMLEMKQAESAGDRGLPGLGEELCGFQSRRP